MLVKPGLLSDLKPLTSHRSIKHGAVQTAIADTVRSWMHRCLTINLQPQRNLHFETHVVILSAWWLLVLCSFIIYFYQFLVRYLICANISCYFNVSKVQLQNSHFLIPSVVAHSKHDRDKPDRHVVRRSGQLPKENQSQLKAKRASSWAVLLSFFLWLVSHISASPNSSACSVSSFFIWTVFLVISRRCRCRTCGRRSGSVRRSSCPSLEWWRTWAASFVRRARLLQAQGGSQCCTALERITGKKSVWVCRQLARSQLFTTTEVGQN